MVYVRIIVVQSDTLNFFISNIVLSVCCVVYNMLTVLNLDIFLFTIVISYFTLTLLFTFKRQNIVLMSFSCPLIFSSSRASFAYLALDTSTALHSLYVSHLSLNRYYILSTQTVDKLLIDFQYHEQKGFIRGFPCILNKLMSELFLIISPILYFHLVCLIIKKKFVCCESMFLQVEHMVYPWFISLLCIRALR